MFRFFFVYLYVIRNLITTIMEQTDIIQELKIIEHNLLLTINAGVLDKISREHLIRGMSHAYESITKLRNKL